MSIISKLFGSRDLRKAKRIIREAEVRVKRTTKPLGEVSLAIIRAAHTCSEAYKPLIHVADVKENQKAEIYVFYEFIYFFMHLTMRSAFAQQLTEQQIGKMQSYLVPVISSTAVDSFFAHWHEDLKKNLRSEFITKLNNAELEYSTCKEFLSKGIKGAFTGNSLFARLARNVADLSGNSMNPVALSFIQDGAVNAFTTMNLNSLVQDAGKVLANDTSLDFLRDPNE
jgi:hypothetical protein